ncbi:MAG: nucleotidyltransferase domain-containing protein [Candidatus Delongbacteria bacterium]|nr:nucleotidyltransferase domain-containing protein [Candidatus Delongbacteria bacterium]MBN2835422.1 nucleotidyltransferase domain-containing protein [Candidatus Delongbacteria bacterium]
MSKSEILKKIREYKDENSIKYGILKIGIFGSASREEMNPDSDIDVVIETVKPDPFIIFHIKEDLENIFNTKIDIVRLRKNMNNLLKERIEKEVSYV